MAITTKHREINFEDEICDHLAANGWLYSPDSSGYDKELALFPEDVLGWLQDTQPEQLAKIVKPDADPTQQAKDEKRLLQRLRKAINLPMQPLGGGGVLQVLRKGFKQTPASFQMSQTKPASTLNETTLKNYSLNRLRVMRQVYYSTKNKKSIDLVLFVNGIPVATLELKTDLTQSISNAVQQYKYDRHPAGEPLLQFGSGALVHFAVSNSEVQMTTKLAGPKTRFLPFNKGHDDGAGNPPNPEGSATSYLWEEILERDTWLNILHNFMQYQEETRTDWDTGKTSKDRRIIFPRFHQWRAVTRLIETARAEGPGHRYLIQHSAGSGKTNSISWLAHRLSNLHDDNNKKIFDTVIVVTDRTVLDGQLQDAISQIDHQSGVVVSVSRETGAPKSQELTKALTSGAQIVIVTIQTFVPTMDLIRETKGLAGRTFAVIADEAHSSQTGTTAGALAQVLTSEEQADLADGGEIDTEALLEITMRNQAEADNISFFAFTATPKAKTLEIFGRTDVNIGANADTSIGADADAKPQAFDLYSMQQAIEEEFILDVLSNYTPYEVAWRLAHGGKEYDSDGSTSNGDSGRGNRDADNRDSDNGEKVDAETARKELLAWVRLHPTNISQKVKIIVEHFRKNVAHLLDGAAKAMVVTGSRKEAVRYKKYLEQYITEQGYKDVRALVAFSGTVQDSEDVGADLTEINMNPGVRGMDLATAFLPTTYNVMIVANKFQTGFDQPRLVAMYVDRKLGGVQAVQTLSRLNRTHPGKDKTFVLDFVNDPEEILKAFKPYYKRATIVDTTNPDLIHDLSVKLDASGIYTMDEIREVSDEIMAGKNPGANSRINKVISKITKRFAAEWLTANAGGDQTEIERLTTIRRDMGSYVKFYDFISQVINFEDPDLLRRQLAFKLALRGLQTPEDRERIDLTDITLDYYRATEGDTVQIELSQGDGLDPITAVGTGRIHEKHRAHLNEIIRKLNERYGEEYGKDTVESTIDALITALSHDPGLREQARVNTEVQFAESTRLDASVTDAFILIYDKVPDFAQAIMSDPVIFNEIKRRFPAMMYEKLRQD